MKRVYELEANSKYHADTIVSAINLRAAMEPSFELTARKKGATVILTFTGDGEGYFTYLRSLFLHDPT